MTAPAATATGPDLTAARAAIERLMDDQCTITPPGNAADGVLGDDGRITYPPQQPRYAGRCMVSKDSTQPAIVTEGGATTVDSAYRLAIPVDAPVPELDDIVEITASRRDPVLVGRRFEIREVTTKTFAVSRRCRIEGRAQ